MTREYILLYVNGRRLEVCGQAAFARLSDFLRGGLRLVGTKVACAEGACGACSVLRGQPDGDKIRYGVVNSCLPSVYHLDGCHVVTVEGLGREDGLSAVQESLADAHGAQCGFCTPGMVIALTAALEDKNISEDGLPEALSGNLCRCTGYLPILEGGRAALHAAPPPLSVLYPEAEMVADLAGSRERPFQISAAGRTVYGPATLDQAAQIKSEHPDAVLVAGGTELAVQAAQPTALLSLGNVAALAEVRREGDMLVLGGGAAWARVKDVAQAEFPELAAFLHRWGAPAVRNMGTVAGSIVQAAPIADSLPVLLVMEARAEVVSAEGTRLAPVDALDLQPSEIVSRVFLPLPRPTQALRLFKVSGRRGFDRSLVSAALLLERQDDRIGAIKIALGGVAPKVVRLPRTEAFLQGRPVEEASFRAAGAVLRSEIAPVTDGRASAAYRGRLAENMLLKFSRALEGSD